MKKLKFTASEKKKIAAVIDNIESEFAATRIHAISPYDNEYGCGNCGDLGPFYKTLNRVRKAVGIKP